MHKAEAEGHSMPHSLRRLEQSRLQLFQWCSGIEALSNEIQKAWREISWPVFRPLALSATFPLPALVWFMVISALGSSLAICLSPWLFSLPFRLSPSTSVTRQSWLDPVNASSAEEALHAGGHLGLLWKPLSPIAALVAATAQPLSTCCNPEISWIPAALAAIQNRFQPSALQSSPSIARRISPVSKPMYLSCSWRMKQRATLTASTKARSRRIQPILRWWGQAKQLPTLLESHKFRRNCETSALAKLLKPRPSLVSDSGFDMVLSLCFYFQYLDVDTPARDGGVRVLVSTPLRGTDRV